jgi:hypothetical protein
MNAYTERDPLDGYPWLPRHYNTDPSKAIDPASKHRAELFGQAPAID